LNKAHKTRDSLAVQLLICRLSWSISSNFVPIHSWNLHRSRKLQKKHETPLFCGFKVI